MARIIITRIIITRLARRAKFEMKNIVRSFILGVDSPPPQCRKEMRAQEVSLAWIASPIILQALLTPPDPGLLRKLEAHDSRFGLSGRLSGLLPCRACSKIPTGFSALPLVWAPPFGSG